MLGRPQRGSSVRSIMVAALVAVLLSGVLYWPPASLAPVPAAVAATDVVPYQATGWTYQQVAFGGLSGFGASSFDDSGWPTGQAAFGSGGGCAVQSTVHTTWSTDTDLLLRRHVALTPGTTGVEVSIVVDNDTIGVYWNGTQIGGPLTHEFCPSLSQPMTFTVSPSLVTADNVLAIRARDRGVESFVDVRVVSGAMGSEPLGAAWEKRENGATSRDPVQTFSGAFLYRFTDLAIPGRGPSPVLARAYNSADTRVGPLGPGWTHSYAVRLRHPDDGSADILFVAADGNTDRFTRNADETFSPSPATYRTLVRNADGTYLVTETSQLRWAFDGSGNLTSITDRFGNVSTLGYDASGQLTSIADPAGRGSLTLGYTSGRLTSVTDWLSPARTVSYGYDASGRLQTVTDRDGTTTTFAYDGTSSRISTIADARGNVALTLTYDAQGRVGTQKDARGLLTGQATTFGYVVNPDGTRATTVTSPPTSFEPPFSPTIEDTYDASGWVTGRVSHPSSAETLAESYTYDATGNRTSVTDPRGGRTDFCYDVSYAGSAISGSRGNLTRRIDPPPTAGANRPVTLLAYDTKDNPTQIVAPKGVASGTSVTCATNLSAINTSYATDLAYDVSGAGLLSITRRYADPDLGAFTAVTKFEYADAANPGLVTRIIPPRGNTGASPDYTYATTFAYVTSGSKAGLLDRVTDALGNATTYDYDAIGRVTSTVDPLGNAAGGVPADHRTDVVYDREDRVRFVKLPAPVAGGAQLVSEARYDAVGNPIARIDAAGQVTTYAYDERDALFQVKESPNPWTDPATPPSDVITTEYAYDAAGDLARMIRAKGDPSYERVTDYVADGRGLVRRETQYPAWPTMTPTLVTAYTYDPNGNRATLLDPLGRTTTYGYDALDRLTAIDYSDPATADVSYAYDPNGNRTSMTDGTGTTTYAYDELDRLLSVMSPGPTTVGYRYDRDGNRTKLIYPDATAVTYTFDTASRLTGLTDWASRTVSYTYWPDGLLRTATNPNSTVATYGYDNARRVTDILNALGTATISHHAYTLDGLGNVGSLAEQLAGVGALGIGTGKAWGSNSQGQLGNGTTTNSSTPVDVTSLTGITSLGAGAEHSLAVRSDGTAWAWGQNLTGELGDGTTIDRTTPVQVTGLTGAVAVDGGPGHSLALRSDGTVWAWGLNNYGQLGDGTTTDRTTPVQVSGLTGVVAIAAGGDHSLALKSDGTVWAWGRNTDGQLGDGSKQKRTSPVRAGTLTGIVAIDGGDSHSLAVKSDGTAWAWGDNFYGQLGDGTSRDRTSPVRVTGFSGAVEVAAGAFHSLARKGDGTVWGWGNNGVGQLGDGTNTSRTSPVRVGTLTDVTNLAAGAHHSLALRSDGTLYAWGYNLYGQLGDGTTTNRTSPVQVPGLSGIAAIAGGAFFSLAATGSGSTSSVSSTYGYDRLYRLISASGPDGAPTYTYDPVGNRLSKVLGGTTTYTYDRADRITAAGAASITVDAAGNLTAKGTDTFAYDGANRLTSATVAGVTETYAYDGDGVRFSRQVGANPAIRYVSDVNGGLPVVLDDGTRKYVWGAGLAYAVAGSSLEVYHTDRLGSVRALTDATGAVTATYRTDEFGVPTSVTGSSAQPFRFTGEPQDATGLLYLRARYYDPALGRFLSRDPWAGSTGVPQTLDRYVYVGNNPATWSDPSGLRGCFTCGPGREMKAKVLSCGGEAHGVLDLAGIINPLADLTNLGLYLCEGDVANALLSGIAVIPGLGDAIKWAGKAVLKALRLGAAVERIYSARVLTRMAEDAGPFHNFPMTLDRWIFEGRRTVVSDTYVLYAQRGFVNGRTGTYEIGVRISEGGGVETIVHRFFRPDP